MFGRKKYKDLTVPEIAPPMIIPQPVQQIQQQYTSPSSLPHIQKSTNPQNEALKELRGNLLEVLNWIDSKIED